MLRWARGERETGETRATAGATETWQRLAESADSLTPEQLELWLRACLQTNRLNVPTKALRKNASRGDASIARYERVD